MNFNTPFLSGKMKLLLVLFILITQCFLNAQNETTKRYAHQAFMTYKVLEKYHYKPQHLNDELSQKLNKEFLKAIDPSGLYFTKNEINEFKRWDNQLDEEIKNESTNYLTIISDVFRKKLNWADSIIMAITEHPFDFNEKDTLHFLVKKSEINYAADEKKLIKRWTKLLKYQTLELLYTPTEKNKDPFSVDVKEMLKNEPEARSKIATRNKKVIRRILEHAEGYYNYMASLYINELVSLYDPHSSFFSASEKQNFESSISSDVLSFGFYFDENENGEIEIVYITPGGSAWKSNQLHKGDVILKIKPELRNIIDLTSIGSDEAMELMSSINDNQAEFSIRKTNGQINKITLIKSKIRSEENIVKSFILKGDKKIGYISLPSFYTELENKNPLGCANDVAKEIVKLQDENIEGLILDLRYNGGGSVGEAMGLMGLFIDEGPLCINKKCNEKPHLLKDYNRGTAYNGALIVMINGLSASASEIFSATLQDYNRAILVGSSTYGKATGQIIIPLDTTFSLSDIEAGALATKESNLGYIKITTEGFYRVTNATHQKKGVSPDINLLEPYYYADYKESSEPYALSNDSITKKVIYTPLAALPIKELRGKSNNRLANNINFKRLNKINDSLRLLSNKEIAIILTPQFFKKNEKITQTLLEDMEKNLYDSASSYIAINNVYDKKVIDFDEFTKEINQRSLSTIQKDIYIEEVYFILKDLINLDKK